MTETIQRPVGACTYCFAWTGRMVGTAYCCVGCETAAAIAAEATARRFVAEAEHAMRKAKLFRQAAAESAMRARQATEGGPG